MEDPELIKKILGGDSAAYADIIRKYQGRILRLCASMLSDEKEAEDAAQEIFLKGFYALGRFKSNASLYTWLYRIASNHCLDLLRKKSRRRTGSWDELSERLGDEAEKLISGRDDGSGNQRQMELVQEVLERLEPDYRLILTLREMEGLHYEEIAQALNCTLDAVRGRLKRAREQFRDILRHFMRSGAV